MFTNILYATDLNVISDQAVKILRIQTAISDQTSSQLIDIQTMVADAARLKGVLPAKVFEDMGGKVEYFGKPYSNVYNQATKIGNKKVLCVGDNLNTDIKGANLQNFDSLLISRGIHRQEIQNESKENLFKKYKVKVDFIQSNLKW